MKIKCMKILRDGYRQQVEEVEAAARKNTKTIIRKLPYKSGLCNRKHHNKNK